MPAHLAFSAFQASGGSSSRAEAAARRPQRMHQVRCQLGCLVLVTASALVPIGGTMRSFSPAAQMSVCYLRKVSRHIPIAADPLTPYNCSLSSRSSRLSPALHLNCYDLCIADAAPESKTNGLLNLVYLAGIFGAWYGTNIIFNIYNKQVCTMFLTFPNQCAYRLTM